MSTKRPQTINVTHNYPAIPAPSEVPHDVVRSLAEAVRANASAIEQNAIAIQRVAAMSGELGVRLNIEASAFTAKNGAVMDISAPTTVSTSSTEKP
jgi:hypothetical protein